MRGFTIVISRSSDGDVDRRTFEDEVLEGLDGRADVLVVPSVYWMTDDDPGLLALRAVTDDIVYVSWLHARPAYWLLRARGVEGESADEVTCDCEGGETCPRTLRTFAFGAFDSSTACAETLLETVGEAPAARLRRFEHDVSPRWYPVVDYSVCAGCAQCHDFCLFGVYALDEWNRPLATDPDKCKPGCPACARICPEGAIMFPQYTADEGIAGAPGKRPENAPIDAAAFFAKSKEPCPVCGCACDCERSTDGTAPPGMTVCPACGCLCAQPGPCACKGQLTPHEETPGVPAEARPCCGKPRDDLDDLIDALDELDV